MRNANIPTTKEAPMRLTLNRIVALAAIAAAGLMAGCSADSPGPTGVKPGTGSNGLSVTFDTIRSVSAGNCTLVTARATQNGTVVPNGTSILLSTNFGTFGQNGLQTISLLSEDGAVTTTLCSNSVGTATVHGTVTIGTQTSPPASASAAFTTNGGATTFISSCANPHSGPVTGGTQIQITGGGFGADGATVPVLFVSGAVVHQATGTVSGGGTVITVTTPAFPELAALPATPVELDVVVNGVALRSPDCFTFTNPTTTAPVVTAILPSSGSKLGGTQVTILGNNFGTQVQVFFVVGTNRIQAQIVSAAPSQIIAITPPASAFGGSVQSFPADAQVVVKNIDCVTSGGGACESDGTLHYTYTVGIVIFGFTPDHGDASTTVTITGQGFVAPLFVTFGGKQGTVLSVTGTQILAKPPAGCPSSGGTIQVTLLSDGETASSPGTFTVNVPTITSGPTPASGPGGSATAVTVIGTNLFPSGSPGQLAIGASGGSVSGVSATEVNGQQTISFSVTPGICSATVALTFVNGATGCPTAATFTNSTFNDAGPAANAAAGAAPTCTGSNHQYTASFTAGLSATGTGNITYSWTFANSDGSAASPPSATGAGSTGSVTFTCPDASPCSGTATLTVTDACGRTATTSLSADSPGCP